MKQRNLGPSGLLVSEVGLGCNNFGRALDVDQTRTVVHKALDLGVTLFNTADVYGGRGRGEEFLGAALGARRKDIVLLTKFGKKMDAAGTLMGGSRRYIMSAVEASLRRLGTDWIDVYEMHDPDPRTPIEESLRALDDLVRQGKVRYIACSHYEGWRLVESRWISRVNNLSGFIACEDEYSLLQRNAERDLFPAMRQHGVSLLPYYPLASGLLTGKYQRGHAPPAGSRIARAERDYAGKYFTDRNWSRIEALTFFARERGVDMLDVALGWLAANPLVGSVIAGATSAAQVAANVNAAAWRPTAEDLAEINRICPL